MQRTGGGGGGGGLPAHVRAGRSVAIPAGARRFLKEYGAARGGLATAAADAGTLLAPAAGVRTADGPETPPRPEQGQVSPLLVGLQGSRNNSSVGSAGGSSGAAELHRHAPLAPQASMPQLRSRGKKPHGAVTRPTPGFVSMSWGGGGGLAAAIQSLQQQQTAPDAGAARPRAGGCAPSSSAYALATTRLGECGEEAAAAAASQLFSAGSCGSGALVFAGSMSAAQLLLPHVGGYHASGGKPANPPWISGNSGLCFAGGAQGWARAPPAWHPRRLLPAHSGATGAAAAVATNPGGTAANPSAAAVYMMAMEATGNRRRKRQ